MDDLRTSRSVLGKNLPNFETLDAKIAHALKKMLAANEFRKKVSIEEQKAQNENRFLRGRKTTRLHDPGLLQSHKYK